MLQSVFVLGDGWGLDAFAHPSATILWPASLVIHEICLQVGASLFIVGVGLILLLPASPFSFRNGSKHSRKKVRLSTSSKP